jgi:hypothetical protein
MQEMNRTDVARWALVLWAIAAVAGCASLAPGKPEEVVRQRAQARWDALLAGEWKTAYGYMSPSYRALVEEKRFANQFGSGAGWVSAEVFKVTCADEKCTVVMEVKFKPILGMRAGNVATTSFEESWIREDGQWWMFQRV